MVSFTVRMEFRESDREQVKDYLRKLIVESRQEPGCISYIPHLVAEGPPAILIYEQYVDEVALEHHRSSAHFARFATDGLYRLITSRQLERLEVIG